MKHTKRFKQQQQIVFFQSLGALLQSGYDMAQSLDTLFLAHHSWRSWLSDIQKDLAAGQSFSDSLRPYVSLDILLQLRLADQHGNLSESLILIGKNLRQIQRQKNKIKQVMRYPMILLIILGALLVGIKYFISPILNQWQNVDMSENKSLFVSMPFVVTTILLIVSVMVMICWFKISSRKKLLILVKLPIIGAIIRTIVTYQVSQQLTVLLANGLTLPQVLESLSDVPQRKVVSKTASAIIAHAKQYLADGESVENYILRQTYFNESLAGYFARGQAPKIIAKHLSYYAKTQFEMAMRQIDRLINTIQPICFGVIGLSIIGVYMSMLLPMYQSIGRLYQ
ncbi:type II secretion system F family protein [Leuconostoc citreum]|uniref:Secretion protein F n=1 Tax=Leuconostoc citreum TaxID=33964 RepID=A0A5A5U3J0_LEUCI|nr:type II secretion system F family protein [Leuconostoc citreum]MBU7451260.1 type II secretion system F family protein [Leuconostoc citreum]GDZ84606.1 secretion protein F [Leuconostoc citreum]